VAKKIDRTWRWKTGDPSGNQACQPSLDNGENEMAISAGNAKHEIGAFRNNDRVGFRMLVPSQAGCN
jgi:hypothetical protein